MAKKQKCPEFENHERWLVAFADMMTLLFALFVVLYAMANLDKSKAKKVEVSIQKAFANEFDDETMPEGVPRGFDMKKAFSDSRRATPIVNRSQPALDVKWLLSSQPTHSALNAI